MTEKEKDTCEVCGVEHDHVHEEGLELDTMILTFEGDDGEDVDVECGVIGVFDVEDKSYIALVVPAEEDSDELEEEFYIYAYSEDEDGEPVLEVIESDEEFDKANDVLESLYLEEAEEDEE